jgi:hypothetical protein
MLCLWTGVWPLGHYRWPNPQASPPKSPIGSTLDQKVPGSTPGGAIAKALFRKHLRDAAFSLLGSC